MIYSEEQDEVSLIKTHPAPVQGTEDSFLTKWLFNMFFMS